MIYFKRFFYARGNGLKYNANRQGSHKSQFAEKQNKKQKSEE
nr:MAG TPA: hypothetical protein [Caudoviricetes sp.]